MTIQLSVKKLLRGVIVWLRPWGKLVIYPCVSATRLKTATLLPLLLLLIASCKAPAPPQGLTEIPCDFLAAEGLADLILETKAPSTWTDSIVDAFQVTPDPYTGVQVVDGQEHRLAAYAWKVGLTSFNMRTKNDALTSLRILFKDAAERPALGKVIECFGPPDYYTISYSGAPDAWRPTFTMDFYNTDRGIRLHIYVPAPTLNSNSDLTLLNQPATATTPVTWIDWVPPGDVREMNLQINDASRITTTQGREAFWQRRAAYYEQMQPWPGSIEQLQVTWADPFWLPEDQPESPLVTLTP